MSTMLDCWGLPPTVQAGRAAERRQRILDTARRLFIQNGFHGTGVAQIAVASGIKVGQIYRDFSSKEDIIAAIAFGDLSQFLDEATLQRAIEQGDMDAVHQWILAFVTYDEDIDGYRLMPEIMAESSRNPRIARLQEQISTRVRDALAVALEAYAPGDARTTARSELADLILTLGGGLCQSIVMEAFQGRDYQPLCRRLRSIVIRELDTIRDEAAPGR
ncbi:MAG: TetR/AcrR family transcriptional regulator [Sphingomonas sp.]|uniref:TetR/AcrR family transcriptional regulator n=1 Tax=Sphingomonas sp. TaxID=28214 RepID=UPI003F822EE4